MTLKLQSMHIKLDPGQTDRLLGWAGKHAAAEVEAGCEPSGYDLVIGVGGPYGCSVEARQGRAALDLGEAQVDWGRGGEFLDELLKHIVGEGRKVPKFQVERAVGPIIDFFIEDIASALFDGDHVVKLAAEFPLKMQNFQSTNIDWLIYNGAREELVFFELKTDPSSLNPTQMERYVSWLGEPTAWARLNSGLEEIAPKSKSKAKYEKLIENLKDRAKDCGDGLGCAPIRIVYLAPAGKNCETAKCPDQVQCFSFTTLFEKVSSYLEKPSRDESTGRKFKVDLKKLCEHLQQLDNDPQHASAGEDGSRRANDAVVTSKLTAQ